MNFDHSFTENRNGIGNIHSGTIRKIFFKSSIDQVPSMVRKVERLHNIVLKSLIEDVGRMGSIG
jgi:hypothetical protein